ncbi:hypothetical protein [Adhaeribacter terreus]|uniref:DoxX family membrane protein n=1 Tax=Adhaeribacter terreus TaxID=529703 RepID=A0ABW0EGR0_9BACT
MKKHFFTPWVLVCLRVFLGFLFFTAGMSKLVPGFPGLMGPVWLEASLAKYDLALFARFIAYSQILIGWLLLSRRFATLGAIMLLPMLLNILLITISQNWRGTPYVVSVFLLMNIWLLAADFHKLKFLISDDVTSLKPQQIVRQKPFDDKLVLLAFIPMFAGAAFGKTNVQLAVTFVVTGLFTGLLLPFLFQLFRTRKPGSEQIPNS